MSKIAKKLYDFLIQYNQTPKDNDDRILGRIFRNVNSDKLGSVSIYCMIRMIYNLIIVCSEDVHQKKLPSKINLIIKLNSLLFHPSRHIIFYN
jgi:hypothetical protein